MIDSAMSSDCTENVSLEVSSAANVVRFTSAPSASGVSAWPVSVSTVAPRSFAYSSARMLSSVVPDSDGMTTIESAPRCTEPDLDELGRHLEERRERRAGLQQPHGGLHEDAGPARPHEEDVARAGPETLGDEGVDRLGERDGARLDGEEAVLVEVQHEWSFRSWSLVVMERSGCCDDQAAAAVISRSTAANDFSSAGRGSKA